MDAQALPLGRAYFGAIKEWPLWFLVAIALSLSVILAVPMFAALIFPGRCHLDIYIARAAKTTFDAISAYREHREDE